MLKWGGVLINNAKGKILRGKDRDDYPNVVLT